MHTNLKLKLIVAVAVVAVVFPAMAPTRPQRDWRPTMRCGGLKCRGRRRCARMGDRQSPFGPGRGGHRGPRRAAAHHRLRSRDVPAVRRQVTGTRTRLSDVTASRPPRPGRRAFRSRVAGGCASGRDGRGGAGDRLPESCLADDGGALLHCAADDRHPVIVECGTPGVVPGGWCCQRHLRRLSQRCGHPPRSTAASERLTIARRTVQPDLHDECGTLRKVNDDGFG